MIDDVLHFPEFARGTVWLVGAGPGDPGLLTLYALDALKQADVVVYDALVGDPVLALAGADAVLEFAGKRGGKPSPKQPDISARLVALAREGKRVLRLKGGDPYVFGRGGEEALALVAAGIPFRVVPGISAGIGGLASAGIPLTHRNVNHAVTFVTGHSAAGDVPDSVDWEALAKGSPVLVIFMVLTHLAEISARLIAAGRPADEPVAIVARATLPDEAVLETTLADAAAAARTADLKPPAMVVVGEVVRLRQGLDWRGALAGRRLDADPLGSGGEG
ncbi:uroporphyrinogen-III C-methyltransferase [Oceanibacterium hippocampi]|uniref:uroporphyrinogen-III C-methyltransferase n=1 Tax=Oceanibacterium hippocampi TaxID=745714 RepID=A0A1Y5TAQ7_9PROT|nr:uroporphyrinogen-III C-methyltransferase [Oceanibacterium hippocampi]SLN57666.1 Uroporphyrinogen-III C-methyltransferase [Oceanibacterium hippocampi]